MYANYSSELVAILAYPMVVSFIWWGEGVLLGTGAQYGVRTIEFLYYVLFAIVLIPFRLSCDALVHSSQELFHGWKVLDYLKYCAHRFERRSERWRGLERGEDSSMHEHLRMIDLMCFSSQYYFVISIGAYGCLLLMFGLQVLTRNYHNPFSDKLTVPVALVVLLILWVSVCLSHVLLSLALSSCSMICFASHLDPCSLFLFILPSLRIFCLSVYIFMNLCLSVSFYGKIFSLRIHVRTYRSKCHLTCHVQY
jgi:hypothetical protein